MKIKIILLTLLFLGGTADYVNASPQENIKFITDQLARSGTEIYDILQSEIDRKNNMQTLITNNGMMMVDISNRVIYGRGIPTDFDSKHSTTLQSLFYRLLADASEKHVTFKFQSPNEEMRVFCFIDPTSQESQQFHQQNLPILLENGFTVEYVLVALNNRDSESYKQVFSIGNKNELLEVLNGKTISNQNKDGKLLQAGMILAVNMVSHSKIPALIESRGQPLKYKWLSTVKGLEILKSEKFRKILSTVPIATRYQVQ